MILLNLSSSSLWAREAIFWFSWWLGSDGFVCWAPFGASSFLEEELGPKDNEDAELKLSFSAVLPALLNSKESIQCEERKETFFVLDHFGIKHQEVAVLALVKFLEFHVFFWDQWRFVHFFRRFLEKFSNPVKNIMTSCLQRPKAI